MPTREQIEGRIKKAVELMKQGWSWQDIAKELGISLTTMYAYKRDVESVLKKEGYDPIYNPLPENPARFSDELFKLDDEKR